MGLGRLILSTNIDRARISTVPFGASEGPVFLESLGRSWIASSASATKIARIKNRVTKNCFLRTGGL